jgi:hypothetical protein
MTHDASIKTKSYRGTQNDDLGMQTAAFVSTSASLHTANASPSTINDAFSRANVPFDETNDASRAADVAFCTMNDPC